jgi:long-chain acyl-CoA synthetase
MIQTCQTDSIISIFRAHVRERRDAAALHTVRAGETATWTWKDLSREVYCWADALDKLGVRRSDRVVQWSENRCEWILTDLALQSLDAIHVPLHATLAGRQAIDQIVHSGAPVVIVSGPNQFQKLSSFELELPEGLKLVAYDKVRRWRGDNVPLMSRLVAQADPARGAKLTEAALAESDITATTTILYTSGTTGQPKGIALSQRNLVSNAQAVVESFGEQPLELKLCILPLSHIFSRTCDLYTWIVRGSELALARNRDTIMDDCERFAPTLVNGVPYFFDRVHQKLAEKGLADRPGIVRRVLGGNIQGCCSGGAALSDQTHDYFEAQGVPLLQGYGLTESSPVISINTPDEHKRGSVGRPLRGVEVRIAEDGEILTRGPHVMLGYWHDEAATRETIRDGWLHTGDLGRMDADGYLTITGRSKEMIVTATGKNVFPAYLESLLCRDPFILQAFVVGDQRKYLTALIVPNPEVLSREIKRRHLFVFSRKSAIRHPQVVELYRQRIEHQLADLSPHEQVRRFTLLDRGFTPENGHLTAKLSLRRDRIGRDFAKEIDAMYSGQTS